jgi:hypothetical protein
MSLLTDLVAYWKLEEASGTRVDSHSTYDLTNDHNTVAQGTGILGNCADFEATNSEGLNTGSDFTVLGGGSALSMSLWIKPESDQTGFRLVAGVNDAGIETFQFWKNGTGNQYGFRLAGTTQGNINIAESVIGTGSWKHVVCTWGSNTMTLYVNNSSQGTASTTGTLRSTNPAPFALGWRPDNNDGFFDGLIDEVGIWSRVLTSDEVSELYNAGAGLSYDDFGGAAPTFIPRVTYY